MYAAGAFKCGKQCSDEGGWGADIGLSVYVHAYCNWPTYVIYNFPFSTSARCCCSYIPGFSSMTHCSPN